jgi:hypothetical protein
MLSSKEINKKIKAAFWDYNIDPHNIYLTALGKKTGAGFFTREKILVRLIERLSWYELIDLFGKEFLIKNLSQSIIGKVRNSEIRNRYESIRKILQGEAVSNTGWSNKNRRRLKASLLSDR